MLRFLILTDVCLCKLCSFGNLGIMMMVQHIIFMIFICCYTCYISFVWDSLAPERDMNYTQVSHIHRRKLHTVKHLLFVVIQFSWISWLAQTTNLTTQRKMYFFKTRMKKTMTDTRPITNGYMSIPFSELYFSGNVF